MESGGVGGENEAIRVEMSIVCGVEFAVFGTFTCIKVFYGDDEGCEDGEADC